MFGLFDFKVGEQDWLSGWACLYECGNTYLHCGFRMLHYSTCLERIGEKEMESLETGEPVLFN
jgi:hypothetical protein